MQQRPKYYIYAKQKSFSGYEVAIKIGDLIQQETSDVKKKIKFGQFMYFF